MPLGTIDPIKADLFGSAVVKDSDGIAIGDSDNAASKLLGHPRRRKPESGQAE
jgi:hypothetical protein